MGIRHILRVLARSRSFRFTRDTAQARTLALAGVRGKPRARFRWRGRDIVYRPATSDPLAIYQVLLRQGGKAEYYLPPALEPQVILDIGSNIGFFTKSFQPQKFTASNRTPRRFEFCKRTSDRFLQSRFSIMHWARPTQKFR